MQNGFPLGKWQNRQKARHKKNKLSADRIKRLNDLGFSWDLLVDKWELGFGETIKYKKQFGTANAPAKYKDKNGFALGNWQNNQKISYKNKKLSAYRVKKLEELEFKWIT
jgi:hypothetical protein